MQKTTQKSQFIPTATETTRMSVLMIWHNCSTLYRTEQFWSSSDCSGRWKWNLNLIVTDWLNETETDYVQEISPPHQLHDESMPSDTLKCQFERHFLADDSSLDDDVDISQQVAALSVVECANLISQLLTYFDAYIGPVSYTHLTLPTKRIV